MKHSQRFLLIPAFNEAEFLDSVLDRVDEADLDLETIVIDDGSSDGTGDIAAAAGVRVVRHPFNLGYGAALQTGYKLAYLCGAGVVIQLDADGQHDPFDVPSLLEPIDNGDADVVIGSRFLGAAGYHMGLVHSFGRILLRCLAGIVGIAVSDPTSGFQALNRKAFQLFLSDTFPTDYPDLDVLLAAYQSGMRIQEKAVTMSQSPRRSNLHSGVVPLYYLYRTMLAVWAVRSNRHGSIGSGETPHD